MEVYQCVVADLSHHLNENTISIEVYENIDSYTMKATVSGNEISVSGNGLFSTFQFLRDELLKSGFGMRCNAARLNALQSGMMADSDYVYLVQLGEPALTTDFYSFWEYANIDKFPNTEEQQQFAEQWANSIKQG
jgi:hypothetical protein